MSTTDELVIVDYGSTDGLTDWLPTQTIFRNVKLVTYNGNTEHFHLTKAKNIAHVYATNKILCNLDVDNWIRNGFSAWLLKNITEISVARGGLMSRGARGRVAMFASTFHSIGGYNEEFLDWGYDVTDLMKRAELAKLDSSIIPNEWLSHIDHGDDMRSISKNSTLALGCNKNITMAEAGKFSGVKLHYDVTVQTLSQRLN